MNIAEIKDSGLLERYILQELTDEEYVLISVYMDKFPELKVEILEIEAALESYAMATAITPSLTAKPTLITAINYMERIEGGEVPVAFPALNTNSKKEDFNIWLNRPDLQEPKQYESIFAHLIGMNEERSSAIVWLKHGAPPEKHSHEIEKFLILEGTCDITIGEKVHSLKAGDYLEIPLHISHHVKVTSAKRCKVILERAAA